MLKVNAACTPAATAGLGCGLPVAVCTNRLLTAPIRLTNAFCVPISVDWNGVEMASGGSGKFCDFVDPATYVLP